MTKSEKAQYATFHRVSNFGKANSTLFPKTSTAGQAFAEVADAAARIDALLVAKPLAAGDGQTKAEARAALHDAMRAVSRTARGLPLIGIVNTLRLPKHPTERALIASARELIERGEVIQSQLVNLGLPSTWLADLREKTTRFTAAVDNRNADHRQSSQAQQGIVEALAHGVHAIRRLDIVVPNALASTPDLLAGWRRDRGGPLGPRRSKMAAAEAAAEAEGEGEAPAPTAAPIEAAPVGGGADDPLRRAS